MTMVAPYNITTGTGNLTSCSDLVCWIRYINDASTISGLNIQVFSTMFVLGSFLLTFIVSSRYRSEDSFLASSFLAFMVSVFLALMNMLNPIVVAMVLFVLGVSVVMRR